MYMTRDPLKDPLIKDPPRDPPRDPLIKILRRPFLLRLNVCIGLIVVWTHVKAKFNIMAPTFIIQNESLFLRIDDEFIYKKNLLKRTLIFRIF